MDQVSSSTAALEGRTVAVIGYGSQGHAHALNLRDSGVEVVVGLRDGSASADKARAESLEVMPVHEAAKRGDVIAFLIHDTAQPAVYAADIEPALDPGNALLFACLLYTSPSPRD